MGKYKVGKLYRKRIIAGDKSNDPNEIHLDELSSGNGGSSNVKYYSKNTPEMIITANTVKFKGDDTNGEIVISPYGVYKNSSNTELYAFSVDWSTPCIMSGTALSLEEMYSLIIPGFTIESLNSFEITEEEYYKV